MPEICRFYGIIIYVYYNDHQPPHFHAVYGELEAVFTIDPLTLFAGHLPPRALGLITEWASIQQEELKKVWNQAQPRQKPDKIEPLK